MARAKWAAAASAAMLSLVAADASAETLSETKVADWVVSCSKNVYCVARTPGRSASGKTMSFKLERANNPNAKIFVTTAPGPKLALGMPVEVSVSGRSYRFFGEVKKVYDGNEMAFVEPFDANTIANLKAGDAAVVTVGFGGEIGEISYDVSLRGVTEALALIDVIQGRLFQVDAAVLTGAAEAARPKDASPTAPAPNDGGLVYEATSLPERVTALAQGLSCDLASALPAFGAQSHDLGGGARLYLVPCQMADLNVPYYGVLERGGAFSRVEFQHSSAETNQGAALITGAIWEPQIQMLSSVQYYSPNADCGGYALHNFYAPEGRFYLSEFRQKETCDGSPTPPEAYPTLWSGEGQ